VKASSCIGSVSITVTYNGSDPIPPCVRISIESNVGSTGGGGTTFGNASNGIGTPEVTEIPVPGVLLGYHAFGTINVVLAVDIDPDSPNYKKATITIFVSTALSVVPDYSTTACISSISVNASVLSAS
jgi:hypothetical protein